MKKFTYLVASFFLVFNLVSAQTINTYYVGHSLSDQIPDMVKSLSNDHSETQFDWVYQSIPGAPLRWQWDRKDAMDYDPLDPHYYGFYDAQFGLASGNFDVLVLTEAVPRYAEIIDETYAYADSFYRYATSFNPDIKVYLYEDWHCILSGTPTGCDFDVDSNPWRQRLDDDLSMWEGVVDILNERFNPKTPVCLIPVGQGLAALYDSIQAGVIPELNEINDIFSDNIHLTDIGKYYVACMHFAMIHETSPVGLTNQLQVWWGGDFEAPSPALALKFQEMAWETVVNYPNSCLDVNTSAIDIEISAFDVYPNPVLDKINIVSPYTGTKGVIYNALGTQVYSFSSLELQFDLDLSFLASGVHFMVLQNEKESSFETIRFLKQ